MTSDRDRRTKPFFLGAEIHGYLLAQGTPPDAIQQDLIDETRRTVGDFAGMKIVPEQGTFETMLTRLVGARRAVGVGTFTG